MDMMALRRQMMGVIAQMGSGGNNIIKGSFTVNVSSGDYFELNYGQSISKYIILIEMKSADVNNLMATGANGNRAYSFFGLHTFNEIDGNIPEQALQIAQVNPSTGAVRIASASNNMSDTSISIRAYADTATASSNLFVNYSYDYTLIPLD